MGAHMMALGILYLKFLTVPVEYLVRLWQLFSCGGAVKRDFSGTTIGAAPTRTVPVTTHIAHSVALKRDEDPYWFLIN